MNIANNLIADLFDAFYNRITNSSGDPDILKMAVATKFLEDAPDILRKFRPTHSYLGQVCSIQSKLFKVSYNVVDRLYFLHEVPMTATNLMQPDLIVTHKVMMRPSSMLQQARIYFGHLPDIVPVVEDYIKAAIRKHSIGTNDKSMNLPHFDLFIPYDDATLDLVQDILHHKISLLGGTLSNDTCRENSKQLVQKFYSILQFYKNKDFSSIQRRQNRDDRLSPVSVLYEAPQPSSSARHQWNSFIGNVHHIQYSPHHNTMSMNRLPVFMRDAMTPIPMGTVPITIQNKNCNPITEGPYKQMCKTVLVTDATKWDDLNAYCTMQKSHVEERASVTRNKTDCDKIRGTPTKQRKDIFSL
jgi:hypothetical protein